MEFAAAALSSIASVGAEAGAAAGVGSVASAAGGAAGIAGSVAGGGSSLFAGLGGLSTAASILSGGATVLSVLNAQRAGDAKAQSLEFQAADADTQTQIEGIQGLDRRASLKRALVQQLGERDVATAASGVDLSFGTPAQARAEDLKAGERALSIDEDTEASRAARLRERAANYRVQAAQARAGGLGTAASLALAGGASLLKRG